MTSVLLERLQQRCRTDQLGQTYLCTCWTGRTRWVRQSLPPAVAQPSCKVALAAVGPRQILKVLLLQQYLQFKRKYRWRCLPFEANSCKCHRYLALLCLAPAEDLVHVADEIGTTCGFEYQQPELREESET